MSKASLEYVDACGVGGPIKGHSSVSRVISPIFLTDKWVVDNFMLLGLVIGIV